MSHDAHKLIRDICVSLDIDNSNGIQYKEEKMKFLDWLYKKSNLIFQTTVIDIPKSWLPDITAFAYEKLKGHLSTENFKIINEYYIKVNKKGDDIYIINKDKEPNIQEKYFIANTLVFQEKCVVWVEFGYNIGSEFKGKHPALVLRNAGDNLIVVPLSSQEPAAKKGYHVKVEKVHKLPMKTRWANIHRIMPISTKRIDFTSPNGSVGREIMNNISSAIKIAGIK